MWRTITLLACTLLCWVNSPVRAAQITCAAAADTFPLCNYGGFLQGEIVKGDYEKAATILGANHPYTATFYLNSPGGDVDEALKIGRLLRKYLIGTVAPLRQVDGGALLYMPHEKIRGICASACALVWFGGIEREGSAGVHRPRFIGPIFQELSAADATVAYRQMLQRIGAYLEEMEVPKSIVEAMVSTGSNDVRWVDAEDDGLDRPPSIAEWASASCPGDTLASMARRFGDPLTPQQYDIGGKKLRCDLLLFQNRRSQLARPDQAKEHPWAVVSEAPSPMSRQGHHITWTFFPFGAGFGVVILLLARRAKLWPRS